MNIGTKIRQLRENKNLSQAELALRLGIEQSSLSKIESNKTEKLDFLFMDKVCKEFNKDFSYFLPNHTINNHIETNNGVVINEGTVNLFPKELQLLLNDIIKTNQQQSKLLSKLKKEFKSS